MRLATTDIEYRQDFIDDLDNWADGNYGRMTRLPDFQVDPSPHWHWLAALPTFTVVVREESVRPFHNRGTAVRFNHPNVPGAADCKPSGPKLNPTRRARRCMLPDEARV